MAELAYPTVIHFHVLLFGLMFVARITIDGQVKPFKQQLARLINEGSSDATEVPLLTTVTSINLWLWIVYLLLFATSYLSNDKPF